MDSVNPLMLTAAKGSGDNLDQKRRKSDEERNREYEEEEQFYSR